MEPINEIQEAGIIERVLKGEKSAFEQIVRKYNADLYKVGRSYNFSHEDSQDLMQDTFIAAYKHLSQFRGNSSLKTWIIRIMLNNCFHKKQKAGYKNETSREIHENARPMFGSTHNDTNHQVHNRELGRMLEQALAEIPADYRMVFSLREINGLNVAETAGLLQISESNVKGRLNRARAMLRNAIERTYPATELFEFHAVYCNAMAEKVMTIINKL